MRYLSDVEYQAHRDSLILILITMTRYGLLPIMAVTAIVNYYAEQATRAESQIVYCVPAPAEETP